MQVHYLWLVGTFMDVSSTKIHHYSKNKKESLQMPTFFSLSPSPFLSFSFFLFFTQMKQQVYWFTSREKTTTISPSPFHFLSLFFFHLPFFLLLHDNFWTYGLKHNILEPVLGRPYGYSAKHCSKSLLKKDFISFLSSFVHSSNTTCMFLPL
jgi:hypothetical protein